MNSDIDTQRLLEKKALRNARALVEKLQAGDRSRSRDTLSLAIIVPCVIVALLAIGGLSFLVMSRMPRPAELAEVTTTAEYIERAISRIERNANRHERDALKGLNGRVGLKIEIHDNGRAAEIQVIQSSWNSAMDSEAARIVKVSEPFGPLPKGHAGPLYMTRVFRFESPARGPGSLAVERASTVMAK
jgi:TonB family protein